MPALGGGRLSFISEVQGLGCPRVPALGGGRLCFMSEVQGSGCDPQQALALPVHGTARILLLLGRLLRHFGVHLGFRVEGLGFNV